MISVVIASDSAEIRVSDLNSFIPDNDNPCNSILKLGKLLISPKLKSRNSSLALRFLFASSFTFAMILSLNRKGKIKAIIKRRRKVIPVILRIFLSIGDELKN